MSEQGERWQVVRNARSHHIERDGEERVYYIADVGDFDALCKRLNALESQVAALQQQVRDLQAKAALADWWGTCATEDGDIPRSEELALWMIWVDEQRGVDPLDSNMHTDIRAWQARYDALSSPDTGRQETSGFDSYMGHAGFVNRPDTGSEEKCHAGRDGDCNWAQCPQEANNRANYQQWCPLARTGSEEGN